MSGTAADLQSTRQLGYQTRTTFPGALCGQVVDKEIDDDFKRGVKLFGQYGKESTKVRQRAELKGDIIFQLEVKEEGRRAPGRELASIARRAGLPTRHGHLCPMFSRRRRPCRRGRLCARGTLESMTADGDGRVRFLRESPVNGLF